jgi:hypothetical protein
VDILLDFVCVAADNVGRKSAHKAGTEHLFCVFCHVCHLRRCDQAIEDVRTDGAWEETIPSIKVFRYQLIIYVRLVQSFDNWECIFFNEIFAVFLCGGKCVHHVRRVRARHGHVTAALHRVDELADLDTQALRIIHVDLSLRHSGLHFFFAVDQLFFLPVPLDPLACRPGDMRSILTSEFAIHL